MNWEKAKLAVRSLFHRKMRRSPCRLDYFVYHLVRRTPKSKKEMCRSVKILHRVLCYNLRRSLDARRIFKASLNLWRRGVLNDPGKSSWHPHIREMYPHASWKWEGLKKNSWAIEWSGSRVLEMSTQHRTRHESAILNRCVRDSGMTQRAEFDSVHRFECLALSTL